MTLYLIPPHTYQERGKVKGEGFHGAAPARLYIDKESDLEILHTFAQDLGVDLSDFDDNPVMPSYTLPTREHYQQAKERGGIILPVSDLLPLIDRGNYPGMALSFERHLSAHLDEEYEE